MTESCSYVSALILLLYACVRALLCLMVIGLFPIYFIVSFNGVFLLLLLLLLLQRNCFMYINSFNFFYLMFFNVLYRKF